MAVWKKAINIKIGNVTKNLGMYVVKYISDQIKKANWERTSGIIQSELSFTCLQCRPSLPERMFERNIWPTLLQNEP